LLSHADTLHLGALPYAMKQLGLSAPVYSTEPVYRLGLLTMYDQYLSRKVKLHTGLFGFAVEKKIFCASWFVGCWISHILIYALVLLITRWNLENVCVL